jgi:DNA-binding GntR family transcriptional regulator
MRSPPHSRLNGALTAAVANHRELIGALRRRDVDAVVGLTGSQFADGVQRLIGRLEEIGLWS